MADIFGKIEKLAGIALLGGVAYLGYQGYKNFKDTGDIFGDTSPKDNSLRGTESAIKTTIERGDDGGVYVKTSAGDASIGGQPSDAAMDTFNMLKKAVESFQQQGNTNESVIPPQSKTSTASIRTATSSSGASSSYKSGTSFGSSGNVGVVVAKTNTVTSKALRGGSKTY